jgi:hypothetical protein
LPVRFRVRHDSDSHGRRRRAGAGAAWVRHCRGSGAPERPGSLRVSRARSESERTSPAATGGPARRKVRPPVAARKVRPERATGCDSRRRRWEVRLSARPGRAPQARPCRLWPWRSAAKLSLGPGPEQRPAGGSAGGALPGLTQGQAASGSPGSELSLDRNPQLTPARPGAGPLYRTVTVIPPGRHSAQQTRTPQTAAAPASSA